MKLYYWSKIYSDYLGSAENYKDLAKTVCINILNFKQLDNYRYNNLYRLKEITTNEEVTYEIITKAKNQLYKLSLDKKTI